MIQKSAIFFFLLIMGRQSEWYVQLMIRRESTKVQSSSAQNGKYSRDVAGVRTCLWCLERSINMQCSDTQNSIHWQSIIWFSTFRQCYSVYVLKVTAIKTKLSEFFVPSRDTSAADFQSDTSWQELLNGSILLLEYTSDLIEQYQNIKW